MRKGYFEAILLSLLACFLVTSSLLGIHTVQLNRLYPSQYWVAHGTTLGQVFLVYGIAALGLAMVSVVVVHRSGESLWGWATSSKQGHLRELRAIFRGLIRDVDLTSSLPWLLALTAVGAVCRVCFLNQPMRYDESYTVIQYVRWSWFDLFSYTLPNNHVLHTILVRFSVGCFGPHPVAVRLPAFLAGVCVIPATWVLTRLLIGRRSGFFAAGLVAIFPYLILYDTMARGYSMLVLFAVCLAICGVRLTRQPSSQLLFLSAIVTALGLFTIPTFLFAATGVVLWIVLLWIYDVHNTRALTFRSLLTYGSSSIALTGILYTPVIIVSNGISPLINNRFVMGLPWADFLDQIGGHSLTTLADFSRDVPDLTLIVGGTLLVIGLARLYRQKAYEAALLLPALLLGGALVLAAKHAIPFPRTWIYLLPFTFVLVNSGIETVRGLSWLGRPMLVSAAAAALVAVVVHRDLIPKYPDTGTFPESPEVVKLLSAETVAGDRLAALIPVDAPLMYYTWVHGIPAERNPQSTNGGRRFFVVKPSVYSLRELWNREAELIFATGDVELYVHTLSRDAAF